MGEFPIIDAFRATGVEPPICEYEGDDPVGFVVSLNLKRRHLNESQRGMVASKLANLSVGRPGKEDNCPVSNADAGKMLNVSDKTVQRSRTVRDNAAPNVIAAVESGEVSVSAAGKTR